VGLGTGLDDKENLTPLEEEGDWEGGEAAVQPAANRYTDYTTPAAKNEINPSKVPKISNILRERK
jgi:hypothetical protein